MRLKQRRSLPKIALVGLATFALSTTGAQAALAARADGPPTPNRPGLIADTRPVPAGVSTDPLPEDQDSGLPAGLQDGLWDLYASHPNINVNALEWDAQSNSLLVYTSTPESTADLFAAYVQRTPVKAVKAAHSKAEIDSVIDRIIEVGGVLSADQRIVTAAPAKDGSSITLGLETTGSAKRMTAPGLTSTLGSSIPLIVEEAPEIAPATRNIGYYVNYFSGALMTKPLSDGWQQWCSTGYRITNMSTSQAGMLSAEHCGRGAIGSTWYYSTAQSSASSLGQYQGMLTVATSSATDTGLWLGGNLSAFYPAVFNGVNDGSSTLTAIRGASIPVLGSSVCYSGSRSGNICGNTVQLTGFLTCYSPTQCYGGQTVTRQSSDVPAAGNGDSGGPAYQSINGQPYGSGVISGVSFPDGNCSGDPSDANRQCSPWVIFAPLDVALGSTWGFNYVP
jgi:hypothetical protein